MIIVRRIRPAKYSALFATYALPEGRKSKDESRKLRRSLKKSQRKGYEQGWKSLDTDPWTGEPTRVIRAKGDVATPPKQSYSSSVGDESNKKMGEAYKKAYEKFNESAKRVRETTTQKVHIDPPKFEFERPKSKLNPKLLLAGLGVAGALGAGAFFTRRRRSKNGKIIVEQVRRKV